MKPERGTASEYPAIPSAEDSHPYTYPRTTPLVNPQLFIGGAVAILCGFAFRYDQWFVHSTPKGSRLKDIFGETRAVWIWRIMLMLGVVFGVCLATGQINPMTWPD